MVSDGRYHNKQRCLVLCSRGVTARYRHLVEDLRTLMPHHKKESKLEAGKDGIARAVNDICELRGCNTVLFLECRKRQDAYMWIGNAGGPSARFLVSNIHTMDELKLTGNCMKHSRPILSFDESFGRLDHLKLLKSLFIDVFGTPRGHPKSKPFVDRVMGFYYADNRVSQRPNRMVRFRILYIGSSQWLKIDQRIQTGAILGWEQPFKDYDGMRLLAETLSIVHVIVCHLFLTVASLIIDMGEKLPNCGRRSCELARIFGDKEKAWAHRSNYTRGNWPSLCPRPYSNLSWFVWRANPLPKPFICFSKRNKITSPS